MALVVICGQPCSGKSTAATCLYDALLSVEPKPAVTIIDESSLHLGRNQSYANMTVEKNLRGVLRSEVDRSMSKGGIIIVDSLNNIKGYRYELRCIARASGKRYCVVFCDTEEDLCREWNCKRAEMGESSFDSNIFEDLVRRFEKPDRKNRWDSPLFKLYPSKEGIQQSSPAIAEAVSYLTTKVDSKTRDIRVLQPTIATRTTFNCILDMHFALSPTKYAYPSSYWLIYYGYHSYASSNIQAHATEANSLYEMDKATQEVIVKIVESQSQVFAGSINKISIGQELPSINIQRPIRLPELRSLRRTFLKLTGQSSLSGRPPPSDADSAKRMFVDYLNREIGKVFLKSEWNG